MLGADPFLASLRRHRLAVGLIVLQAALTTVLLALAFAKASDLRTRISQPSGVDEARLLRLVLGGPVDAAGRLREREALARLPGVSRITPINQVPFGKDYWSADFSPAPGWHNGSVRATIYLGDTDMRQQLGVALLAGRDFAPQAYSATTSDLGHPDQVQIDATLAQTLFHGEPAIGRTLHAMGTRSLRVVGIYRPLPGPRADGTPSLILPVRFPPDQNAPYLLRLQDDRRPTAEQITTAITAASAQRWIVNYRSIAELREAYFQHDRWLATGLLAGTALWLLCTGVGLANLADLLLQARARQIGLCRALGARSAQIRWQLRRENLLLAGTGALAGLAVLHLLLRAWPWLGMQLDAGGAVGQGLAVAMMLLTGQCALWPIARQADAVPLAGVPRHA